jgi:DNA-binding NtrC family response regulator
LRVLEEKEITRIGDTRPRKIDIRILAATNKDLEQEVSRGHFRADLLYRIRVARVSLPSLRERREDIPLLVESFLGKSRAATGKAAERLDDESLRLVMDYAWPGNVRELRNAIEFAVIRCRGGVIQPDDLPPEVRRPPVAVSPRREYEFKEERQRILDALEKAKGRRDEAARMLGMSRATLYRRMRVCMLTPAR